MPTAVWQEMFSTAQQFGKPFSAQPRHRLAADPAALITKPGLLSCLLLPDDGLRFNPTFCSNLKVTTIIPVRLV